MRNRHLLLLAILPTALGAQMPEDTVLAVESLRLGSVDGPDAFTFPGALAIRPDGSVVVAFPQESSVLMLDPSGRAIRRFGGSGRGPGEIVRMTGFGVHGDTVWVLDDWRYTRWHVDAGEGHTGVPWRPNEGGDDLPYPQGRLLDGTLVYQDRIRSSGRLAGGMADAVPLMTPRGEGIAFDTLTTIDRTGSSLVLKDPSTDGPNGVYTGPPFPMDDLWISHPSVHGLVIADRRSEAAGGAVLLRILGHDGAERASTRLHVQGRPEVGERERSEILSWAADILMDARSSSPRDRAQARGWAEGSLGPMEVREPVAELRGASDGLIWMRVSEAAPMVEPEGGDPGQLWIVLDAWLEPLQWVRLPPGFRFLDARGSTVWGSVRGELDVPYLVRLDLPGQASR